MQRFHLLSPFLVLLFLNTKQVFQDVHDYLIYACLRKYQQEVSSSEKSLISDDNIEVHNASISEFFQ